MKDESWCTCHPGQTCTVSAAPAPAWSQPRLLWKSACLPAFPIYNPVNNAKDEVTLLAPRDEETSSVATKLQNPECVFSRSSASQNNNKKRWKKTRTCPRVVGGGHCFSLLFEKIIHELLECPFNNSVRPCRRACPREKAAGDFSLSGLRLKHGRRGQGRRPPHRPAGREATPGRA